MKNWKEQIKLPEKPSGMAYGFISKWGGKPIPCDKATLMTTLETKPKTRYVTTPAHDTFIIPGSDYETLQPLLKQRKSTIKMNLWFSAFFTFMFALLLFITDSSSGEMWYNNSFFLSLLAIGILPLFKALYELITIKKINEHNFVAESTWMKFYAWLSQKVSIPIFIITGISIAIAWVQHKAGIELSLELVGTTKTQFFTGEYWRILSVSLLHINMLFILTNTILIFIMGHLVSKIAGFAYIPIIFLTAGLVGNLLGLYLSPDSITAGISSGIMGLIGFVLILSIKLRAYIPRQITEAMLYIIALVMICSLGFSGIEPLSNIAHAGGLISGMLIGILSFQSQKNIIPYSSSSVINILGLIATFILIVGFGIVVNGLV